MTVCASGPSYGRITALTSEPGVEKLAGGFAIVRRYARFAREILDCSHLEMAVPSRPTNDSVIEDDVQAGIVDPLDLQALMLGECSLDVLRLKLFGEAREHEDTSDRSGERSRRGGHCAALCGLSRAGSFTFCARVRR
jgi:hypothetical protein